MPTRRPSPVTAGLVAVLGVALGIGALAPGVTQAAADQADRQVVAADQDRVQLASQTSRSGSRRQYSESGLAAAEISPLAFGALADQLERAQRRQERAAAQRAAARRARERLAFLERWVMPIHSYTWSAGFGESGWMWSKGYHTGQDWTAPSGTPVYAAHRGSITFAGWGDAYGNKLVITTPDGTQAWYAHLSDFTRTSGTVEAGELVGYVGCTGNCFGNHLHFEIHLWDGDDVDPVRWLRRRNVYL